MFGRKDCTQEELDHARTAVDGPLVLDRYFVHRLRMVTGKDTNPLNEVKMIADSLINNDGVLQGNNAIKWIPERSVLELRIGDSIRLTAADFERLSAAFFVDLERKFL